jgi:hypothetical protein
MLVSSLAKTLHFLVFAIFFFSFSSFFSNNVSSSKRRFRKVKISILIIYNDLFTHFSIFLFETFEIRFFGLV